MEGQEEQLDDGFDAAFDEFSKPETADTPADSEALPGEPEQQEENESESQPAATDEDWQHKYDSMMGRLRAAQNENRELQERLKAFEESAKPADEPETIAKGDADFVEDQELAELDEKVRPLFREKSKEGARARKLLEEFGPEYAQTYAETVTDRRDLVNFKTEMQQQAANEVRARHQNALAEAFPEFADALLERDQKATMDLREGVIAYINTLPYSEGVRAMEIAERGNTEDVKKLLRSYSEFRNGSSPTKQLAEANMAVPRRGPVQAQGAADKDDFDAAWEEAMRT